MRTTFAFALVWMMACHQKADVGTTRFIDVPKDSRTLCTGQCQQIGLELSSVVIMANNVGCVCSVSTKPDAAGPAAGGVSTIMLQLAAAAAAQQQRQQQYQQQHH